MNVYQLKTRKDVVIAIYNACCGIIDLYDKEIYGDLPERAKMTLEDARNAIRDGCKDYGARDVFWSCFCDSVKELETQAKRYRIRNYELLSVLRQKAEETF